MLAFSCKKFIAIAHDEYHIDPLTLKNFAVFSFHIFHIDIGIHQKHRPGSVAKSKYILFYLHHVK